MVRQLVTFLLAGLLLAFVWAPPSSAEPVQLRLSFQLPITGTLGVNLARFKEAVGRDTGNAVAIDIIHGSRALPDRSVAKSVMAGEIEMASANVVTLAAMVKGVDILSLPFLLNSNKPLRAAVLIARRRPWATSAFEVPRGNAAPAHDKRCAGLRTPA
jgi:TRAP-type C4-dicarboxylate transport system substrate-binding protein